MNEGCVIKTENKSMTDLRPEWCTRKRNSILKATNSEEIGSKGSLFNVLTC